MNKLARFGLAYIATALIFLPCDFAWLTVTTSRLYQPALGSHLASQPDLVAAAAFYLLYFLGVVVFVVVPLDDRIAAGGSRRKILLSGVLFGIVSYGTYDLTNQATLSGWPWYLTVLDMLWGGFLTGAASSLGRCVLDHFFKRTERQNVTYH